MIIKTITCHDVYNAGAKLQCFALQNYLEQNNHEVEIIDYRPYYLTSPYSLFGINSKYKSNPLLALIYILKNLPRKLKKLKQRKAYDKFSKTYLKYTNTTYKTYQELKDNPPIAQLYIAGSDQIWNPFFNNGRDPAFYLGFTDKNMGIRASYAASMATNEIPKEHEIKLKKLVTSLDFISVREFSSINHLNKIGRNDVIQVVDPVFLYSSTEWDKLLNVQTRSDKYIFVYDFDKSEQVRKLALNLAHKHKAKIYSIQNLKYSDRILDSIDPIEFLSYLKGAKAVISNSFHATAFSIIYQKEFYVIPRNENINARMTNLLSDLGIITRIIVNDEDYATMSTINWSAVTEKLLLHVKSSKEFLSLLTNGAQSLDNTL